MQKAQIFGLLAIIFLLSSHNSLADKPDWVKKRPVSQIYYIGIAVAQKTGDSKDYMQMAKDEALNDLASQIQVNIAGEMLQNIVEKSGVVEDEFIKQIRVSTLAELEGFELVDTYEDKNDYWAYYRLPKSLYAERKQAKISSAVNLSLDLFIKAHENIGAGNIAQALQYYLQAFNPIETYLAEPLEVIYEDSTIYLANEIYSSVQDLLSQVQFIAKANEIGAKIGRPVSEPLELTAFYKNPSGPKTQIANLPIAFSFMRGDADFVSQARTDTAGSAGSVISKIKAIDKIQIIKAALDLKALINYPEASVIMQSIVNSFTPPDTKFVLYVSGPSVYVISQEIHQGENLAIPAIEPALKSALSAKGFTFTDSPSAADITIEVKAQSRNGSEIMDGMYSSFVDMTIAATDITSGAEVYKKSFQKIKGIDLDYDKAGLKAFKAAGETAANEAVPEMIGVIQR